MATILAGRFETIAPAERAARAFLRSGFALDDISIFHVNAPGQHHALALGGDEDADPEAEPARRSSVAGAAVGALALGVLGWMAGNYLAPDWVGTVGLLGALLGAYLGSFYGTLAGLATQATRNRRMSRPEVDDSAYAPRMAGIVVALRLDNVGPDDAGIALRSFGMLGARDIELTDGAWDGGWTDFDPVREPHRILEHVGEQRPR